MNLYEEIMSRLNKGESVDTITKDITDTINKAINQKNSTEKEQKAKEEGIVAILQAMKDYIVSFYHDEDIEQFIDSLEPAKIVKAIDEGLNEANELIAQMEKCPRKASANDVLHDWILRI